MRKGALKICSKFTREHLERSVISIKLLCYYTEITLRHEYSVVNLLHIFRTLFYKNPLEGLLLESAKDECSTECVTKRTSKT